MPALNPAANPMVQPELWGVFGESATAWEMCRDWCAEHMLANGSQPLAMIVGFLKAKGFEDSCISAAFILYVEGRKV